MVYINFNERDKNRGGGLFYLIIVMYKLRLGLM